MKNRWTSVLFRSLAGLALLVAVGCSKPEEDPLGKEGDSCRVSADCEPELACSDAVCVVKGSNNNGTNNGTNNTNNGGTNNNGTNNGDNNGVADEDYLISYILEPDEDPRELRLYDTATDEDIKISPDDLDCQLGCWINDALTHFVHVRRNAADFDVMVSTVDDEKVVQDDATPIAVGVRGIGVDGNTVSYLRTEDSDTNAYYQELGSPGDVFVGRIGAATATEGDFYVDDTTNTGVVYSTTLQTMDVKIGDLGSAIDDVTFTIDSSNYQEVSGSYFGGNVPTAISDDGKYMALITQRAPMDYNACSTTGECTGPGQRCGRFERCSAIEVVVHFFDMESLDDLGSGCAHDDECGPVHTCDIPAQDQIDKAKCIPRRVVLGLPGDQMQEGQTGCALTEDLPDYHYTDIRSPLSFDGDGHLMLVAARDCGDYNIEDADILKLHPTSDEYEEVYGNPGGNFDEALCYDPEEQEIDITECLLWVERAHLSPQGREIAFIGTNPNVVEPAKAQNHVDLWSVKSNGQEHAWLGQHPELHLVQSIRIHPHPE